MKVQKKKCKSLHTYTKKVLRSTPAADVRHFNFDDFWKSKIRKKMQLRIVKINWVFMCLLAKTFKRRKP